MSVKDYSMSESKKKKMGRPRVDSTPITVRLAPDQLDWLDEQRTKLDPEPSRPEMIRRLMEEWKGRHQ
ncbi:hypothetical protein [Paracoccus sp. SCSIO 75233]|uniref:hypothetical protein n=1 Tax=Paracoccus sp. SCSIO 75233 TaxID=3017782 RepID=UPI0022F10E14|nr:hypothetical protein [Paracoccus sp. SCSIO 75233]WBU53329.1 hypothetical protein PAF12_00360 [Paracoccus sp. SCSIO 75233]